MKILHIGHIKSARGVTGPSNSVRGLAAAQLALYNYTSRRACERGTACKTPEEGHCQLFKFQLDFCKMHYSVDNNIEGYSIATTIPTAGVGTISGQPVRMMDHLHEMAKPEYNGTKGLLESVLVLFGIDRYRCTLPSPLSAEGFQPAFCQPHFFRLQCIFVSYRSFLQKSSI